MSCSVPHRRLKREVSVTEKGKRSNRWIAELYPPHNKHEQCGAVTVMGSQPAGVYVFAVLLYIFPSAFLWAAWRREARAGSADARPLWRESCLKFAFVAAACGTVFSLMFLLSYLHNGGGIHGSRTSPGLWKALGPISAGVSVLSFLLSAAVRSRGLLLLVGWLLGLFAANYAVFQVALD